VALAVLALVVAIAASVIGYRLSRDSTNQESYFGDVDNPNRVEVNAWISRVDPTKQLLSLTVNSVTPVGALADEDGNFAADATLTASSIGNWRFPIKAGDAASDDDLQVVIFGPVTDYPFDRYDSRIELHILDADGKELPTAVTVVNTDAFFNIGTSAGEADNGGTLINLSIRRSPSTLVFAISIMVLMLGLAAAAATAAFYVLHWKRGLVFPACSLMAAMLFALIPLRNAVPGNPPIGSIIDFGSFFIAEAVIAISLISCVLVGYRQQLKADKAEI
jgi:hypothetical protein